MTPLRLDTNAPRMARLCGLFYAAIILCGVGGQGLIRQPLMAALDAEQLATSIRAAQLPFRLSILLDVVMTLADVAVAALLYSVMKPVSELLSRMAMAFRLVQAAILGLNLLNLHQAVALASEPGAGSAAQVAMFLDAHAAGYDLALFFFGVNCLLVAALVLASTFLPRALGWMLLTAAVVYLTGSTLRVVAPAAVEGFAPAYVVPLIAELAFCAWLLIKAVDAPTWERMARAGLDP